MQGIVEGVYQNERNTKFGVKTAYSVKINGEYYGNAFTDPGVVQGDTVEFAYTMNGKFKNLSSIRKVHVSSPPPMTGSTTSSDDRQTLIVRQSSITRSIELLNLEGTNLKGPDLLKEVLLTAEVFTDYVFNGLPEELKYMDMPGPNGHVTPNDDDDVPF